MRARGGRARESWKWQYFDDARKEQRKLIGMAKQVVATDHPDAAWQEDSSDIVTDAATDGGASIDSRGQGQ